LLALVRVSLAALLIAWIGAVVTDRYFPALGYLLHFGLRERPLTYAHEAARFAGKPGLPDRALVYDLGQTGAYVYHNGPRRKVFMDARLEVPSVATLQTYVRLHTLLNRQDPRGLALLRTLGEPLVMLDHGTSMGAEAALWNDPSWRCVEFDPIASVFVASSRTDLQSSYPTVDFATRHFAGGSPTALTPEATYAEARALVELGAALRRAGPDARFVRAGAALLARDLALNVVAARPEWPAPWTVLGHSARDFTMAPQAPPAPDDPWDPATGIAWGQATYAYRQALALNPQNRAALLSLRDAFASRRMTDARVRVDAALARPDATLDLRVERPSLIDRADWSVAERAAVKALEWGDPTTALWCWKRSENSASNALRFARMADALLAAFDLDDAIKLYEHALRAEPRLGVAWYGLALARIQRGRRVEALAACRSGLALPLTEPQRASLLAFEELLRR
jgi:hypothetical protein